MKKLLFYILTLFVSLIFLAIGAFGGTVSLDQTFNSTGYRIQSINVDGSIGESVGVQSDGKIVLGGWTLGIAFYDSFAAMRLNSNGTLDTGFNNTGTVITTVANFNRGDTLLLQTDGKILLNGNRYFGDSNNDFTILRYNTNGTLDNTFDGNGIAAPVITGFSDDYAYDMALQTDGKIVMVGSTSPTTTINQMLPTDIAIMRLNTNGSLDTSFNGTGILKIVFNGVSESANALVIQNDGKIVIGGFLNNFIKDEFLLMRFNSNGFLDTSFGDSGLTITSVSGGNDSITTMALQSDGKILAGGSSFIARYTVNGILDTSFGSSGVVTAPHRVNKILIRDNDKFLIGGTSGSNVAVSRYNANGALDTSFNNTGTATGNAPGNSCSGRSVAVQSDNKIVMGGDCTSNGNTRFTVFRFQEATVKGYLDFDYDGDGKADIAVFRPSTGTWYILNSGNGTFTIINFGLAEDKPVPADFDGDGRSDIAVFRPSSNVWYLQQSTAGFAAQQFGSSGDKPTPNAFVR